MGIFVVLALIIAWVLYLVIVKRVTVQEHQRGLLYKQGRYLRTLEPGVYRLLNWQRRVELYDMRQRIEALSGQELLCADGTTVKLTLFALYALADPYLAVSQFVDYKPALYYILQSALRDVVAAQNIEELLKDRRSVGVQVLELSARQLAAYGIELKHVSVRDVMLPASLKHSLSAEVEARLNSLAALEKARGEAAVMRSLANTAQLIVKNPQLLQLKMLEKLENATGNTIVFDMSGGLKTRTILDATATSATDAAE